MNALPSGEKPSSILEDDEMMFYDYGDVARIMRVDRATVRAWAYRGVIKKTVKNGRKTLVPASELKRFILSRTKVQEKKTFPIRPWPIVPHVSPLPAPAVAPGEAVAPSIQN